MKKIIYVTSNKGKFAEISSYTQQHQLPFVVEQLDYDLTEPQTLDQKFIAVEKAKQAWELIKQPLIIDDSGIYFEKYNQFPGVLSKFVYDGIGLDGVFRLVQPGDRAYFLIYLVYVWGPEQYTIFEERCYGTVMYPKHNHSSLRYLPLFVPDGATVSIDQMEKAESDRFNFRIKAFEQLIRSLNF